MSDGADFAERLQRFSGTLSRDPRWAELKEVLAERSRVVSPFQILGVQTSEIHHSRVLKWLLYPGAGHGLNSRFLEAFVRRTLEGAQRAGIEGASPESLVGIDWTQTEIRLEWQRIDILVLNRAAGIVCAIENKIGAAEGFGETGVSQLTGYRRVLDRYFPTFHKHRVFLTPTGVESGSEAERRFWFAESYVTVQDLLVAILEECREYLAPEAVAFLAQYDAILRRYVVPGNDAAGALAQELYLEERDLFEFIYRNRPDYRAVIKQALIEAIEAHDGWYLIDDNRDYVWFGISEWSEIPAQQTGLRFAPDHSELLLWAFYLPASGVDVWGPALVIGRGSDEQARQSLFDLAHQHRGIFDPREDELGDFSVHMYEYHRDLLIDSDLGANWADGSTRLKLVGYVEDFARDRMPAINRLVLECLKAL